MNQCIFSEYANVALYDINASVNMWCNSYPTNNEPLIVAFHSMARSGPTIIGFEKRHDLSRRSCIWLICLSNYRISVSSHLIISPRSTSMIPSCSNLGASHLKDLGFLVLNRWSICLVQLSASSAGGRPGHRTWRRNRAPPLAIPPWLWSPGPGRPGRPGPPPRWRESNEKASLDGIWYMVDIWLIYDWYMVEIWLI